MLLELDRRGQKKDEIRTCENCKHAQQHYIIGCNGYFVKLRGVMNCGHGKITKKQFKINFKRVNVCQYWEPFELKKQENEDKIEYMLKFIGERLTKILEVLESNSLDI